MTVTQSSQQVLKHFVSAPLCVGLLCCIFEPMINE